MAGAPFQPATNYWRAVEIAVAAEELVLQGRGLDLGCGDGKLTGVILSAKNAEPGSILELVGIDLDPAETALAKATQLYQTVHTCSATEIPEPDASFDFVFSNSVLEHIGPIDRVLDEVSRLLKPRGVFIFTVPGPDFHACLKGGGTGRESRAAYLHEIDARCAHLRYWDASQWGNELSRRGMRITKHRSYLSERQTQRWENLSRMTGGLLYRVSGMFGKRKRPIEIQRSLHLRNASPRIFGRLAAGLSPLLAIGAPLDFTYRNAPTEPNMFACLCVSAVRKELPTP
jgi:SAM-dependent methyltransferase